MFCYCYPLTITNFNFQQKEQKNFPFIKSIFFTTERKLEVLERYVFQLWQLIWLNLVLLYLVKNDDADQQKEQNFPFMR